MGQHVRTVRSTDNRDAVADGASNRVVAPGSAPARCSTAGQLPANWRSAARQPRRTWALSRLPLPLRSGRPDGRGATGYVLVSSQGDDRFVVYSRQGANRPLGTFQIRGVDGVDDING